MPQAAAAQGKGPALWNISSLKFPWQGMTGAGAAPATSSSLTLAPAPWPQSSSGVSNQVLSPPRHRLGLQMLPQASGEPKDMKNHISEDSQLLQLNTGWEAQCQNRQDRPPGSSLEFLLQTTFHQPSQSATLCSCHFCQRCRTPN